MDDLRLHGLIGGAGLKEFYGDGSDGVLNTTGDIILTSTLNGPAIIKQYESITVNIGDTLTVSNPCQGLVLYSKGDIVIDGTIDMSKKAINGIVNLEDILLSLNNENKTHLRIINSLKNVQGGAGGNGGNGGAGDSTYGSSRGPAGISGKSRKLLGGLGGGGGGGGAVNGTPGVKGGRGGIIDLAQQGDDDSAPSATTYYGLTYTYYPGHGMGPGHGGSGANERRGSTQWNLNGSGGRCYGAGGGGGGSGSCVSGTYNGENGADGEYAGGFILLIAAGNITVNGVLIASGGKGGDGGDASVGFPSNYSNYNGGGGGGGGAGGGVIALFHKGLFINNGSLVVNGGAGGAGGLKGDGYDPDKGENGFSGNSGSVGTVHIEKL